MDSKTNKTLEASRVGRTIRYSVEELDAIPEVACRAVEDLRAGYESMKKVSRMDVSVSILMVEPPSPPPLPEDLEFIEVSDDSPELTEQEKWECTARWLNSSYRAYIDGKYISNEEHPCARCPLYETKCARPANPPQMNFKVIERFTGPNTIIGHAIDSGM